jgi:hypothetical protein
MLSWSGQELAKHDESVAALGGIKIESIASGEGDAGLPFGRELIAFADAIAGYDNDVLASARRHLVDSAGDSAMVDAAAVAANFEMMTRVADGTGARFAADVHDKRTTLGNVLGVQERR